MFTKDFWITKLKGYERKEERGRRKRKKTEEGEKRKIFGISDFSSTNTPEV